MQLNKGGLTFEDVLQSLYVQGQNMNTVEVNSHSMLILGILVPALTTKGQIKLQMPREIVGNDSGFIKSILNLIYVKCGGTDFPMVEEFKTDAIMFLKNKLNMQQQQQLPKYQELHQQHQPQHQQPGGNKNSDYHFAGGLGNDSSSYGMMNRPPNEMLMNNNINPILLNNMAARKNPAMMAAPGGGYGMPGSAGMGALSAMQAQNTAGAAGSSKPNTGLSADSELPDDHKQTASRIEFEKSEPIVRLLAQVRKVGMDVLFPQSTHDKVRDLIFDAIPI